MVLPDPTRSIFEGAIVPWGEDPANWYRFMLRGVANHFNFNFRTRFCDLPKEAQKVILFGSGSKEFRFAYEHSNGRGRGEFTGKFEGVIPKSRAPLPSDGVGIGAAVDRAVHAHDSVPGLQGPRV